MARWTAMLRNALPPMVLVVILIVALLVYDAHRSSTVVCYGSTSISRRGLTPLGSSSTSTTPSHTPSAPTTLPPSHDNDAGISRQRDATPDADVDTYQRPRFCFGNGHRVTLH